MNNGPNSLARINRALNSDSTREVLLTGAAVAKAAWGRGVAEVMQIL
jgi:hypothetical protein